MTKKKSAKSNRKSRAFSVSFREQDLEELQDHIDGLKKKFGYSLTRNELIRRATLAHIRHQEKPDVPYNETFKNLE